VTVDEAHKVAKAIMLALPGRMRVKAVHVHPRNHEGVLNIRVFAYPTSPDEPEAYIFTSEEVA
jgi:hypothetical protein